MFFTERQLAIKTHYVIIVSYPPTKDALKSWAGLIYWPNCQILAHTNGTTKAVSDTLVGEGMASTKGLISLLTWCYGTNAENQSEGIKTK